MNISPRKENLTSFSLELTPMVVMGSAAVELKFHATAFTKANTTPSGTGKMEAVSIVFHTQLTPFSCLKSLPAIMPPARPLKAYMRMAAVSSAPRRVALKTPRHTQVSSTKTVQKSCAPEPMNATNRFRWLGLRKTSP